MINEIQATAGQVFDMPQLRKVSRGRNCWPGEARQIKQDEGGRRTLATGVTGEKVASRTAIVQLIWRLSKGRPDRR